MANENQKFDIRLLERKIARGAITQKDYDAHVSGLEDVAENAVAVEVQFESASDEETEEEAAAADE